MMMESESEVSFGKLSQSNRSSSSQEREIIYSSSPRKMSSTSPRSRSNRMGRETEEEAIIRRFHDAQRMARFRARKKKALEDKQTQQQQQQQHGTKETEAEARLQEAPETESKYTQLLAIIERLGRDVRLSYAGSRSSAERLKSGIVKARGLVRDCLTETRINLRQ